MKQHLTGYTDTTPSLCLSKWWRSPRTLPMWSSPHGFPRSFLDRGKSHLQNGQAPWCFRSSRRCRKQTLRRLSLVHKPEPRCPYRRPRSPDPRSLHSLLSSINHGNSGCPKNIWRAIDWRSFCLNVSFFSLLLMDYHSINDPISYPISQHGRHCRGSSNRLLQIVP